ncbi:hypothetical protein D3C73_816510 [compost metagenome]
MGVAVVGQFVTVERDATHQPLALITLVITEMSKRPGIDLHVFDIGIGEAPALDGRTPRWIVLHGFHAQVELLNHDRCMTLAFNVDRLPIDKGLAVQIHQRFEGVARQLIQHQGKCTPGKCLAWHMLQYLALIRLGEVQVREAAFIVKVFFPFQDATRQSKFF